MGIFDRIINKKDSLYKKGVEIEKDRDMKSLDDKYLVTKKEEYTSAVEAFNSAKEGDHFDLIVKNPRMGEGGESQYTTTDRTSFQELVKVGDYFVPVEDINKSTEPSSNRLEIRRSYNPKNLDKNNKFIRLIKR